MTPAYYHAYVYRDETVVHFEKYYLLYSTAFYDFCTPSINLALQAEGKSPLEIREMCKNWGFKPLRVDNRYSRKVRKTKKEAIEHLMHRKRKYEQYLKQYLAETAKFLNHAEHTTVDQMLVESEKRYGPA